MDTIGKRIKHFRRQKRITQKELSDLSGVSATYLSEIEGDKKNNITTCVLCDICRALELTPNDLIPKQNYQRGMK